MKPKIHRLLLSCEDIWEASLVLAEWSHDLPPVVRRALLIAAIVSYCRPFTTNYGPGALRKLDIADYLKADHSSDRPLLELHQVLMHLRDKVVAHSDFDVQPVTLGARTTTGFTFDRLKVDVLMAPISIDDFRRLCSIVQSRCTDEMHRLANDLMPPP